MKVHVRLFGTLGNDIPEHDTREGLTTEVPDGTTVTQLVRHLNIPTTKIGIVSVNGQLVYPKHVLSPDDVVRIFRPIFGG